MIPAFAIDGGVRLALARGAASATAIAATGALLHARFILPRTLAEPTSRRLRAWTAACLVAALVAPPIWLFLETIDLAGNAAPLSIALVLRKTQYGHLLLLRETLLLISLLAFAWRWRSAALGLAATALATEAGLSHAAAVLNATLTLSVLLHLAAAAAWLGGLLPLWIVLSKEPASTGQRAARRLARLGFAAVLTLLITSSYQAATLIGTVPAALSTGYGWIATGKALGLATLIWLAAQNYFRHTPALTRTQAAQAALRRAILAETAIGLAIVLAAGALAQMEPAMDMH